jgi:hypothetical protein
VSDGGEPISVKAPDSLRDLMERALSIPDDVRASMERALAEELVLLEEDLRGPTADSPATGNATGPHPLSDGPGLVPINTGRLLSSMEATQVGLALVLTADAQDPRSDFFYASVAHHSGRPVGETKDLVTARWTAMADAAGKAMEEILTRHLQAGEAS